MELACCTPEWHCWGNYNDIPWILIGLIWKLFFVIPEAHGFGLNSWFADGARLVVRSFQH
ncbi:hypothetical protein BDV33DRAFT_168547 [Aspergillus novoparasiticus]|uniref:Uncharacterized protein n=1 Tax=Aspergillus novoparasiticus TaxID=986946 RepID=A0A5N6EZD9_9EURO|nr:hypothetical protein BDV33DRAFT_168547 [Aspergillus novoparasiticus]